MTSASVKCQCNEWQKKMILLEQCIKREANYSYSYCYAFLSEGKCGWYFCSIGVVVWMEHVHPTYNVVTFSGDVCLIHCW